MNYFPLKEMVVFNQPRDQNLIPEVENSQLPSRKVQFSKKAFAFTTTGILVLILSLSIALGIISNHLKQVTKSLQESDELTESFLSHPHFYQQFLDSAVLTNDLELMQDLLVHPPENKTITKDITNEAF